MSRPAESNSQTREAVAAKRRRIRWAVRAASLVAAVLLLLATRQTQGPFWVPALSFFVTLGSILTTRTVSLIAAPGLIVALIVALRTRWFCKWVCPLGLCAETAARLGQRCGRKSPRVFALGPWIVLLTLGGASVGYPLLLWLDPLALFSGAFGAAGAAATWLAAVPLLLVLALSFVWPHLWCGRICPLGASQDMLAHPARRFRTRTTEDCPKLRWNLPLARRTVLGAAVGAAFAWGARTIHRAGRRPLRPPGAIDEPGFLGLCVRCGNCIRACPTHIIKPAVGQHGLASLLTPVLQFTENYCLVDCTRCMAVCPSGALARLSVEDKADKPIGLAKVDMRVCLLADGRDCSECRRWCPHEAIRYVWCEVEYTLIPKIDPVRCTGCGACEAVCPTKPTRAIVVVALGDPARRTENRGPDGLCVQPFRESALQSVGVDVG